MDKLIKAWLCLFVGAVLGATFSWLEYESLSIMSVTIGGMFFGRLTVLHDLDKRGE